MNYHTNHYEVKTMDNKMIGRYRFPAGYVVVQQSLNDDDPPPFVAAWFVTKRDANVYLERTAGVVGYQFHMVPTHKLSGLMRNLKTKAVAQ
jgi:hypothetical protein